MITSKFKGFYKRAVRKLLSVDDFEQKLLERIRKDFEDVENQNHYKRSRNISYQLQIEALSQTSRYVQKHMQQAKVLSNKLEMYDFLSDQIINKEGILCEFGVYKGFSINYLANEINRNIHGFDSFEGLPEFWRPGFEKGFFMIEEEEKVVFHPNVILHEGLFGESIPKFKNKYSGKMSFIHIDCDLYCSTKTIFDLLGDRITSGCLILFDEYFNYPGWQMHEFRAFQEFIKVSGLDYEYLAYINTDEQVAVRIV